MFRSKILRIKPIKIVISDQYKYDYWYQHSNATPGCTVHILYLSGAISIEKYQLKTVKAYC